MPDSPWDNDRRIESLPDPPKRPEVQMILMVVRNENEVDPWELVKWNTGLLKPGEKIRNAEGINRVG